jgi:hypothetical protein
MTAWQDALNASHADGWPWDTDAEAQAELDRLSAEILPSHPSADVEGSQVVPVVIGAAGTTSIRDTGRRHNADPVTERPL